MARKSRYAPVEEAPAPAPAVWLAAAYGRLSVEDGDDCEQNSIGNQKKLVLHYLEDRSDIRLTETYADNGYTGMRFDRPGFQKMLAELRAGRLNCVLVKDVSRLGRDFLQTSELVERIFPELGARLICINDGYDSAAENADAAALLLPFQMVMNDSYAKDVSRKIKTSIAAKMKEGAYLPAAGSVPYGYVRNAEEKTFAIDPAAAETVARIFALRAEGAAFNKIAGILNAEGVPSPGRLRYLRGVTKAESYQNAAWTRGTVRKLAGDQVYLGNRVHGREKRDRLGLAKTRREPPEWRIVENAHPPIVDGALFQRVREVNRRELEARSRFETRAAPAEDFRELLRGKVLCGHCQSAMTGGKSCARPHAKTPSRVFFECGRYTSSGRTQCASRYVRQEALLGAVTNALNRQVEIAVDLERLVKELQSSPKALAYQRLARDNLAGVRAGRRSLEGRLERLLIDLTEGLLSREEYDYAKAQYHARRQALLREEREAEEKAAALERALASCESWLSAMRRYQRLPAVNRELVELLVKRILVYDGKRIKIELNFADPMAAALQWKEKLSEVTENAG